MAATTTERTVSTWQLDPTHSSVEFAVKHLMMTTVRGRFKELSATLRGDRDNPEDAAVEASLEAASVDTGSPDRDAHLRSADFFDADRVEMARDGLLEVEAAGVIGLLERALRHGPLRVALVDDEDALAPVDAGRGVLAGLLLDPHAVRVDGGERLDGVRGQGFGLGGGRGKSGGDQRAGHGNGPQ